MSRREPVEKKCRQCGEPFKTRRADRLFCSDRCRYESFAERRKSNKPTSPIDARLDRIETMLKRIAEKLGV